MLLLLTGVALFMIALVVYLASRKRTYKWLDDRVDIATTFVLDPELLEKMRSKNIKFDDIINMAERNCPEWSALSGDERRQIVREFASKEVQ